LTLGHLIIIPNWPWISLGKVPSTLWEELLNLKDEVSSKLTKYYTKPIFVEHGSSQYMTTGGCVTHAHLHAVPCSLDLLPALAENQLDFKKIKTIHDLSKLGSKDVSYIFFENLSGDMYISETNKKIQRQFIRIEIGKSLGIEDPYWDWGVFVNKVLLKETVRALSQDIWETN
jgi:ABC-type Zn uptake system ZnuABC Zn-binding protein ZnuA